LKASVSLTSESASEEQLTSYQTGVSVDLRQLKC